MTKLGVETRDYIGLTLGCVERFWWRYQAGGPTAINSMTFDSVRYLTGRGGELDRGLAVWLNSQFESFSGLAVNDRFLPASVDSQVQSIRDFSGAEGLGRPSTRDHLEDGWIEFTGDPCLGNNGRFIEVGMRADCLSHEATRISAQ